MADIRINALATTAASTASDDFVAVDGSANGTRKLNAYSPTFGGNVTASGNLTVSGVTTSAGISNSGALTFTAAIGQVAGSIAKNATYGLTYYGVTGSSNDNTMLNASGAVVLSNPAGTTNATLTGNLTVSGTGTSTFAGNITSTKNLDSLTTETDYGLRVSNTAGDGGLYIGANSTVSVIQSIDPGTTFDRKLAINPTGGNVLVGTTVDSANGKLQLATHTTSAGGIGFGTAISLFSLNSSNLLASAASGAFIFGIGSAGARKGYLYWDTSSMIVGTDVGNLVLDAAGGNVTITNGRSLVLGNSYVAGAPTATGYVTIKDSAGNTYKVLVGT